jgi:hypothetical protein
VIKLKSIIFCLALLLTSGCALLSPPKEKIPLFDNNESQALKSVATLLNDDRKGYIESKNSLIDWGKNNIKNREIIKEDIIRAISGSENARSAVSSYVMYIMYYFLKDVALGDSCVQSASCVFSVIESSAEKSLENSDQKFLESYQADNKKFKFKQYDPEKIQPLMREFALGIVNAKKARKQLEIDENSKLPDTVPVTFKYANDKYVNAALTLINSAKLEKHNIRDSNGNKTKEYGKPTIYGKPFIGYRQLPRVLLQQVKSCEKISAYAQVDVDSPCKRSIVSGVKDWVETAKDPNISDLAWRMAANDAIIGNEIFFSHWAGMARVHQKSINETGRPSF